MKSKAIVAHDIPTRTSVLQKQTRLEGTSKKKILSILGKSINEFDNVVSSQENNTRSQSTVELTKK